MYVQLSTIDLICEKGPGNRMVFYSSSWINMDRAGIGWEICGFGHQTAEGMKVYEMKMIIKL